MSNSTDSTTWTQAHLTGPKLWLARVIAYGGIILYLGLFCLAIPTFYKGELFNVNLKWADLLPQMGLTAKGLVFYLLGLVVVQAVIYAGLAFFLLWRRSDSGLVLGMAFSLVVFGTLFSSYAAAAYLNQWLSFNLNPQTIAYLETIRPNLGLLPDLAYMIATVTILLFMCLLPDGRWVPKWAWFPAMLWMIHLLGVNFLPGTAIYHNLQAVAYGQLVFYGSGIVAQIYRFKISTPTQRQQIKWIFLGVVLIFVGFVVALFPYFAFGVDPAQDASATGLNYFLWVFLPAMSLPRMLFPFFLVFATLRYRLWDVDFVINRALVYGALTALLAVLLGGSLYAVSRLFENFTGGPLVAVAITSLVFGAAFQPTRRALQRFVDQRFYHIAIDYQKKAPRQLALPPVPLLEGQTNILQQTGFSSYRDLQPIGRGGMAEVYRAVHPTLNVPVAIKILSPSLATDPDFKYRFRREAQVIEKLRHPNIVRVYDYGEMGETNFIVMEYINGTDLGNFLKQSGALPLEQALPILKQIARALDYAHTNGVVHRDIKPSNIMLEECPPSDSHPAGSQRAVLMDFGIVRIIGSQTAMTGTAVIGTLEYIAPEQIQNAPLVGPPADVYAFGVMAYKMLTGSLPFTHNNAGALLLAHLNQPAPDPRGLAPALSESAAHAVQQALGKDPQKRFQLAGEFIRAIDPDKHRPD